MYYKHHPSGAAWHTGHVGITGGGIGTNQYALRGVSQARRQETAVLDDLSFFAPDDDWQDRSTDATNPHTPPAILAALASDHRPGVRDAVARNPSTPPDALARLASDEHTFVRLGVASNPHTPSSVLVALSNDPAPEVRQAVAKYGLALAR